MTIQKGDRVTFLRDGERCVGEVVNVLRDIENALVYWKVEDDGVLIGTFDLDALTKIETKGAANGTAHD
jgi:hypothetical protein